MICESCNKQFEPHDPRQIYCSAKCKSNSPKAKTRMHQFQQERRDRINAYKTARGCCVCGYNSHPAALHFDHLGDNKSFNISQDPKRAWNLIEAEMAKCRVICANCHSIKTYELNEYHSKRKSNR